MIHFIQRLYYFLTGWIPRPLPKDGETWYRFQMVLTTYFGVPDTCQVWMTIAGHVSSTDSGKMYRAWAYFANIGKRQHFVNPAAQAVRQSASEQLKKKLEEFVQQEQAKADAEAAAKGDNGGENPSSPETVQANAEVD